MTLQKISFCKEKRYLGQLASIGRSVRVRKAFGMSANDSGGLRVAFEDSTKWRAEGQEAEERACYSVG